MATYSGIFDNSGYTLYLDVSESNVSISNNTSVVNWTLRIVSTKSLTYGSWDWDGTPYSVSIDGSVVASGSQAYDFRNYQNLTIASGSRTITHNSDGSRSVYCSASFGNSSTPIGDAGAGGTLTLTSIPRQANITSAQDFNDEQNPTITYSNSAGNSVSSLQACISLTGSTDDIKYRDISKTGSSYTFNLTENERNVLRNATTTSNSRQVIFHVRTVIGGNTYYSTSTKTLSIVNATLSLGTFTYKDSNSVTTAISENNQRIIRNNSNLLFTIGSATAKKSATISKYEITFNQVTKSRTSAGTLDFGTINLSSNATATLSVTDSRGNTSKKNVTVIIDDWVLPTALISLNRKNNFYSETYLKVDGSCSSLNGKNAMSIQYQYKKVSDKTFSAFYDLEDNVQKTLDLDNEHQWNISIVVTDKIGQTTYNVVLDRGMPIVFFDRLKNSVGINSFPKNEKSIEENGNQMFGLETGTWTPTIGALNEDDPTVTYTYQRGSYTKIGKMVFISIYLRGRITSLNGSNNYACIKGIPFTSKDYAMGQQSFGIGVIYNVVNSTTDLSLGLNNQVIRIQNSYGAGASNLKLSGNTDFEVGCSGWYEME